MFYSFTQCTKSDKHYKQTTIITQHYTRAAAVIKLTCQRNIFVPITRNK